MPKRVVTLFGSVGEFVPEDAAAPIEVEQSNTDGQSYPTNCDVSLTGVTAGNAIIVIVSYFRTNAHPNETETFATPTDSAGTFSAALNPTPYRWQGVYDLGVAVFVQHNVSAGTHTITTSGTNTNITNCTAIEVSGLATSASVDVSASASASDTGTSQSTGTTGTTAQANELAIIALAMGAPSGSTDVGYTDPVSGYTTLHVIPNDASNAATFHAYKVLSGTGAQSATFNWTHSETNQGRQALIVTFKGA